MTETAVKVEGITDSQLARLRGSGWRDAQLDTFRGEGPGWERFWDPSTEGQRQICQAVWHDGEGWVGNADFGGIMSDDFDTLEAALDYLDSERVRYKQWYGGQGAAVEGQCTKQAERFNALAA